MAVKGLIVIFHTSVCSASYLEKPKLFTSFVTPSHPSLPQKSSLSSSFHLHHETTLDQSSFHFMCPNNKKTNEQLNTKRVRDLEEVGSCESRDIVLNEQ